MKNNSLRLFLLFVIGLVRCRGAAKFLCRETFL